MLEKCLTRDELEAELHILQKEKQVLEEKYHSLLCAAKLIRNHPSTYGSEFSRELVMKALDLIGE